MGHLVLVNTCTVQEGTRLPTVSTTAIYLELCHKYTKINTTRLSKNGNMVKRYSLSFYCFAIFAFESSCFYSCLLVHSTTTSISCETRFNQCIYRYSHASNRFVEVYMYLQVLNPELQCLLKVKEDLS